MTLQELRESVANTLVMIETLRQAVGGLETFVMRYGTQINDPEGAPPLSEAIDVDALLVLVAPAYESRVEIIETAFDTLQADEPYET